MKSFLFCSVVCFLVSCGNKNESPKKLLDPNKKIEDQKRLEKALELEQELRKKVQQADIEGTTTPIVNDSTPSSTQKSTTQPTAVPLSRQSPSVVTPVCARTPIVKKAILKKSGKTDCKNITIEDLQAIVALVLGSTNPWSTYPTIFSLKSGDFSGLTSLKILNLAGNSLRTLPEGIFDELTSLEVLNLAENNLQTLPAGIFDGLILLKELNLRWCGWDIFFQKNLFSKLTNLEYLDLLQGYGMCNPSSPSMYLSVEIFNKLTSLQTLMLSDDFTSVPNGIFKNLSSLKNLHIGGCFQTLRSTVFTGLNSLEILSISSYKDNLTILPQEIFSPLNLLKELDLSNNGLESLPPFMFKGLSLLEKLHLNDNNLTLLPEQIFQGLTLLKELWLQGNEMQSLPPRIFKGLSSLETLLLNGNDFTSFPPGALEGLPSLKYLSLAGIDINAEELARVRKELRYVLHRPGFIFLPP